MDAALARYDIGGIHHNVPYLRWLLGSDAFQAGRYDTGIVARLGAFEPDHGADPQGTALAALLHHRSQRASRPSGDDRAGSTWAQAARLAITGR